MNKDILNYAYRLISIKDYTSSEIKDKIKFKFNIGDEPLNSFVNELKELCLIDDERYKKLYVEQKLRDGYGPYYIVNGLYKKGIVVNCIGVGEVATSEEIDYCEEAKKILYKKFKNFDNIKKCYQFLERRGFYKDTILKVIKEVNPDGSLIF